jgi:hypothetical protein
VKLERLKIASEQISRKLVLFQSRKVLQGLPLRPRKILPRTLLFDDKNALPEEIDESSIIAQELYRFFVACDAPSVDAEDPRWTPENRPSVDTSKAANGIGPGHQYL